MCVAKQTGALNCYRGVSGKGPNLKPSKSQPFPLITFIFPRHMYTDSNLKGIELLEVHLLEIFDRIGIVPIIVGGDLNARTGVENEILHHVHLERYIDGFGGCDEIVDTYCDLPPRNSCDPHITNFGLQLLHFCKVHSLFIANGRCKGDELGKITCIANGGRSVNDYAVLSLSLGREHRERRIQIQIVFSLLKPSCAADK